MKVYLAEIEKGEAPRRQREVAAVRALVVKVFGPEAVLGHTSLGAPYIVGRPDFISISHSRHTVALMVDSAPCGVDVEEERDNLKKVCRRILTEEEYCSFQDRLLWAWTGKEALYKASRHLFDVETDYARQIRLDPPCVLDRQGYVVACYKLEYKELGFNQLLALATEDSTGELL